MSIKVDNAVPAQVINQSVTTSSEKKLPTETLNSSSLKESHNTLSTKENSGVTSDPFDKNNEGRKVLKPFGKSNGRNFYFLYTLEGTHNILAMRTPNKLMVQDDILRLRAKGYTVIIDNKTTTSDFKNAAYDQKAFGIVSLGHGGEGALITFADNGDPDGDYIIHHDIESKKVSKNLKVVMLEACQAGLAREGWKKAFNTDVVAWEKSVSNVEVLAANGHYAAAGLFPGVGAYFSINNQMENRALGKIIGERL